MDKSKTSAITGVAVLAGIIGLRFLNPIIVILVAVVILCALYKRAQNQREDKEYAELQEQIASQRAADLEDFKEHLALNRHQSKLWQHQAMEKAADLIASGGIYRDDAAAMLEEHNVPYEFAQLEPPDEEPEYEPELEPIFVPTVISSNAPVGPAIRRIASATQNGTWVNVKDEDGRPMTSHSGILMGYTATSVSIKKGNWITTYDQNGSVRSSTPS